LELLAKACHKYSAEIQLHSFGGHDIFIDDPEWIIERVQKFLAQNKEVATSPNELFESPH
jgi:hypothetical protein